MSDEKVLLEMAGNVAVLTLNRPEVLNAMDRGMVEMIWDYIRRIEENDDVCVVVITGAGDRAFSAGADLNEMENISAYEWDRSMELWTDTFKCISSLNKPVIAAINGYALGGGTELAMACHVRVASDNAVMGQPEILLDHIPGAGGTQRLTRLIPLGAAYEFLLTGDNIPASEAWRLGLVNHTWPQEELYSKTIELASRIAERSPVAIRYTLDVIRCGIESSLDSALRMERGVSGIVMETEEAQAGLSRFLSQKKK